MLVLHRALYLPLLFILALWSILFEQLSFEWYHNPQYNYGLFLPFIAAGLFWSRLQEGLPGASLAFSLGRPRHLERGAYAFLLLVACMHVPLRILSKPNTDWRLLLWVQALLDLSATFVTIYLLAGKPGLKHFFYPAVFLLFAIPWPKWIETAMIHHLLRLVAYTTTELMSLLGIFCIQKGNIILFSAGKLQIEEACSGVRSFQSLVMMGFLFGEVFRFKCMPRLLLVGAGGGLALFFNLLRTSALGLLTHFNGPSSALKWHDSSGYGVLLGGIGSLCGLAYVWQKHFPAHLQGKQVERPTAERVQSGLFRNAATTHRWVWIVGIGILGAACVAPFYWYRSALTSGQARKVWTIDWNKLEAPATFGQLPKRIEEALCYPHAAVVQWESDPQVQWLVYFFTWPSIKAAQLAGFHSPDLCLKATGWHSQEGASTVNTWEKDGLKLFFNSCAFKLNDCLAHVFYCQWDTANYPFYTKHGRLHKDRLTDALHGHLRIGQRSLEVIIIGKASLGEAWQAVEGFLSQTFAGVELEG